MAHRYADMKREAREWLKGALSELDPEEVLQCYAPEARLKGLDAEARLKGLDTDEWLKGLDPKVIEAWLNKIRRDHR